MRTDTLSAAATMPEGGRALPPQSRRRKLEWGLRQATAGLRALPDFLIIGAAKAGSTSLYDYLVEHPAIETAFRKEVHYFDQNLGMGENWYRAHFPLKSRMTGGRITGEATPYYCFHPAVPALAGRLLPEAKLLFILRDPIARAYSHYQQNLRRGLETLSFAEAVAAEPGRLAEPQAKLKAGEVDYDETHQHLSYVTRGLYADQLTAWLQHYPAERIHVLFTEELATDPDPVLQPVLRFLGVAPFRYDTPKTSNSGRYDLDIDPALYQHLRDHYAASDKMLSEFTGRSLPWRAD